MKCLSRVGLALAGLFAITGAASAFPKPNPYPVSWELKFDHAHPKRVVVTPRGAQLAEAYWYMTYTVTNLGREPQKFLPVFELLTEDGKVIRSDGTQWVRNRQTGEYKAIVDPIAPEVLQTIRVRERMPGLQTPSDMGGTIRPGVDQAKDGVVIWREPDAEMGQFTIFVTGLSGESTILTDASGKPRMWEIKRGDKVKEEPIVVWKTLRIRYHMVGDEKYPGIDDYELVGEDWLMRCPDEGETVQRTEKK